MNDSTLLPVDQYVSRVELLIERGCYRQAIATTSEGLKHYPAAEALQLWRAVATDATGDTDSALKLIQPLTSAGDIDVRQQARYLSKIWSAPSLKRHDNWMARMDIGDIEDRPVTLMAPRALSTPQFKQQTSSPKSPPASENRHNPVAPGWLWALVVVSCIGLVVLALPTLQ